MSMQILCIPPVLEVESNKGISAIVNVSYREAESLILTVIDLPTCPKEKLHRPGHAMGLEYYATEFSVCLCVC